MNKECPVCCDSRVEWIKLNYTLFRHFGFVDFQENGEIGRCCECGLLIHFLNASQEKKLFDIYESLDYAEGKITSQTFLLDDGRRVTRPFLQAQMLQEYLSNDEEVRVLDIGCFKGELLLELDKRFPKAKFHGFDVNENLKKSFPIKENFIFYFFDFLNIEGKFDLICISLSMMYIKDISGLLKNIQRLLKKNGKVFIQLVDIIKNSYSVLLGDQYYHFTPCILKNVLNKAGFDFTVYDNDHFPRDIVGVACLADQDRSFQPEEDLNIYRSIEFLDRIKGELNSISKESKLCVLGTTTVAAFVDSILGKRIQFFVDENISDLKDAAKFRDKKVVLPQSFDRSIHLILPYGISNERIKNRFCRNYGLRNFHLV